MKHMYIKAFAWETFTWSFYLSRTYLMHRCTIGQPDWPRTSILKVVSYGHRSKLFLNKFLFFILIWAAKSHRWRGFPRSSSIKYLSLSGRKVHLVTQRLISAPPQGDRLPDFTVKPIKFVTASAWLMWFPLPSILTCRLVWVRASAATVWETISTFPHCSYRHRRLSYFTPCL